jgi:hypothetical protein
MGKDGSLKNTASAVRLSRRKHPVLREIIGRHRQSAGFAEGTGRFFVVFVIFVVRDAG